VGGSKQGMCPTFLTILIGSLMVLADATPSKQVLGLHSGLRKAENSVLVEARTGRIGLARYLYSVRCLECSLLGVGAVLERKCRTHNNSHRLVNHRLPTCKSIGSHHICPHFD
jgi:hypothetical protein